jgi:hypothetical protein
LSMQAGKDTGRVSMRKRGRERESASERKRESESERASAYHERYSVTGSKEEQTSNHFFRLTDKQPLLPCQMTAVSERASDSRREHAENTPNLSPKPETLHPKDSSTGHQMTAVTNMSPGTSMTHTEQAKTSDSRREEAKSCRQTAQGNASFKP